MCALPDGSAKSSVVLDRELDQEKSLDPSGPRIRCPLCGGRPARTTAGLIPAATCGTRSIPEECARRASTTGPQPNVFRVPAGRSISIGIGNDSESSDGLGICGIISQCMLAVDTQP